MKFSKLWIYEFLNINKINIRKLLNIINKSSLEVNEILNISKNINKAITGKIINSYKINKDKYLIEIDIGKLNYIKIEHNLNLKINKIVIIIYKSNKNLFLYSPYNIKISNDKNTVFLPKKTKLGINVIKLLKLNDSLIDINIPLNRPDCYSILGISREISTINGSNSINIKNKNIKSTINSSISIKIENEKICKKYIGLIIKNSLIYNKIPILMEEKLRKSGFYITNTIDNIINYIFIETGYIINIFNLDIINNILIKKTEYNNKYINLKKRNIFLLKNTLLISDFNNKLLYIPGINYKYNRFLSKNKSNIFIGCGSFNNNLIENNYNNYYKNYDFNKKIEHEVDYTNLKKIINYTANTILSICGGNSSSIIKDNLNKKKITKKIHLNVEKLLKKLGFYIPIKIIESILIKLNFNINIKNNNTIIIDIPHYRLDLNLEEDIIEEIIKKYGYKKIPNNKSHLKLNFYKNKIYKNKFHIINKIKNYLVNKGYNEIINYSFINKLDQLFIYKDHKPIEIINPISKNMSVMRISLLTGLINSIKFNVDRQEKNMKLFENGFCFTTDENKNIIQNNLLSGILYGYKKNDFLNLKNNELFDFYDLKGDLEHILLFFMNKEDFIFKKEQFYIFNKNECSSILNSNKKFIGYIGYINNSILRRFKLNNRIIFFEINLNLINESNKHIHEINSLPINKRDVSILINNEESIEEIINISYKIKDKQIIKINLISFYYDKNICNNFKKITLRFYIQNNYRNLLVNEINNIIDNHIIKLKNFFKIQI